jgi:hypothetical protein
MPRPAFDDSLQPAAREQLGLVVRLDYDSNGGRS